MLAKGFVDVLLRGASLADQTMHRPSGHMHSVVEGAVAVVHVVVLILLHGQLELPVRVLADEVLISPGLPLRGSLVAVHLLHLAVLVADAL